MYDFYKFLYCVVQVLTNLKEKKSKSMSKKNKEKQKQ